jgi:hypothetical protein
VPGISDALGRRPAGVLLALALGGAMAVQGKLIAQIRQREDLVLKSPGIGRMSVKDAYFWNAPC